MQLNEIGYTVNNSKLKNTKKNTKKSLIIVSIVPVLPQTATDKVSESCRQQTIFMWWSTQEKHKPVKLQNMAVFGSTAKMSEPSLSFSSSSDFENVYEPSDDSWLFMDALSDEREWLLHSHPNICIEIGCGSGIILCHLALLLKNGDSREANLPWFIGTDVNEFALCFSKNTFFHNKVCVFFSLQVTDI